MKRLSSWDYPNRSFPDSLNRFADALKYYYWGSFFEAPSWRIETLEVGLDSRGLKGILQEELLGSLGMWHVYS